MNEFNFGQFLKKYGSEKKCLDYLIKLKCPDGIYCKQCERVKKFTKIRTRTVYQCSCGYQVSPLVGTIFEKSSTPLTYWFYAIFLMSNTRSGISAKQLQRELGVTYKTAWRMFKQIRILMQYTTDKLKGTIEVDETYVGGKGWNRRYIPNFNEKPKEVVFGMVERNGNAKLLHLPGNGRRQLVEEIQKNIDKGSYIISDQYAAYNYVTKIGYTHDFVTHRKEYVSKKDPNVYTQNIESIWSHLKRGIFGVYRKTSKKYLQSYVNEFAFRYNYRNQNMFDILIKQSINSKIK